METVWQKTYDTYNYIFDDLVDPRMKGRFLVASPFLSIAIVGFYLFFCLKAGPMLMKNRQPLKIKKLIQCYNVFEVILCTFVFVTGCLGYYVDGYSFKCQPVVKENTPGTVLVLIACYLYYINKYIELLDTVFFVLRKKNGQVTFLHVYHHAFMPLATSIGATWFPGGHVTLMGLANSFIHVVMYSYYFLSSLGPEMQKYLWWKKHLTVMQLIQFCFIFVHNFQVLFRECEFPKLLNLLLCFEAGYFFYLFSKFYIRTYEKSKKEPIKNGKHATKTH